MNNLQNNNLYARGEINQNNSFHLENAQINLSSGEQINGKIDKDNSILKFSNLDSITSEEINLSSKVSNLKNLDYEDLNFSKVVSHQKSDNENVSSNGAVNLNRDLANESNCEEISLHGSDIVVAPAKIKQINDEGSTNIYNEEKKESLEIHKEGCENNDKYLVSDSNSLNKTEKNSKIGKTKKEQTKGSTFDRKNKIASGNVPNIRPHRLTPRRSVFEMLQGQIKDEPANSKVITASDNKKKTRALSRKINSHDDENDDYMDDSSENSDDSVEDNSEIFENEKNNSSGSKSQSRKNLKPVTLFDDNDLPLKGKKPSKGRKRQAASSSRHNQDNDDYSQDELDLSSGINDKKPSPNTSPNINNNEIDPSHPNKDDDEEINNFGGFGEKKFAGLSSLRNNINKNEADDSSDSGGVVESRMIGRKRRGSEDEGEEEDQSDLDIFQLTDYENKNGGDKNSYDINMHNKGDSSNFENGGKPWYECHEEKKIGKLDLVENSVKFGKTDKIPQTSSVADKSNVGLVGNNNASSSTKKFNFDFQSKKFCRTKDFVRDDKKSGIGGNSSSNVSSFSNKLKNGCPINPENQNCSSYQKSSQYLDEKEYQRKKSQLQLWEKKLRFMDVEMDERACLIRSGEGRVTRAERRLDDLEALLKCREKALNRLSTKNDKENSSIGNSQQQDKIDSLISVTESNNSNNNKRRRLNSQNLESKPKKEPISFIESLQAGDIQPPINNKDKYKNVVEKERLLTQSKICDKTDKLLKSSSDNDKSSSKLSSLVTENASDLKDRINKSPIKINPHVNQQQYSRNRSLSQTNEDPDGLEGEIKTTFFDLVLRQQQWICEEHKKLDLRERAIARRETEFNKNLRNFKLAQQQQQEKQLKDLENVKVNNGNERVESVEATNADYKNKVQTNLETGFEAKLEKNKKTTDLVNEIVDNKNRKSIDSIQIKKENITSYRNSTNGFTSVNKKNDSIINKNIDSTANINYSISEKNVDNKKITKEDINQNENSAENDKTIEMVKNNYGMEIIDVNKSLEMIEVVELSNSISQATDSMMVDNFKEITDAIELLDEQNVDEVTIVENQNLISGGLNMNDAVKMEEYEIQVEAESITNKTNHHDHIIPSDKMKKSNELMVNVIQNNTTNSYAINAFDSDLHIASIDNNINAETIQVTTVDHNIVNVNSNIKSLNNTLSGNSNQPSVGNKTMDLKIIESSEGVSNDVVHSQIDGEMSIMGDNGMEKGSTIIDDIRSKVTIFEQMDDEEMAEEFED